jgi:hypothetical protein
MVDRYVELLQSVEQVSIASYRHARADVPARDFTLVEFEVDEKDAGGTLFEGAENPWLVTFWINSATNLISRVEAVAQAENEDGTSVQMELLQVFNYTCPSICEPEAYSEPEESPELPEPPTLH